MKKIILSLFILSLNLYASNPIGFAEYKYCATEAGEIRDAYFNLVDFKENQIGMQMFNKNFVVSFIINVDGKKHTTSERIFGYEFNYIAAYAQNMLKLVFEDEYAARALGMNQKFIAQFIGDTVRFVFNDDILICRRSYPVRL